MVFFSFFRSCEIAGVPHLKWFGVEGGYSCMVIDLLGPSLEDLFNYSNRIFSLKSVLMLADQLVTNLFTLITSGLLWSLRISSSFVLSCINGADMQS